MKEGSVTSKWLSLESIPRQKTCACFSLKLGCILSALILILYSVFAIAQCAVALGSLPAQLNADDSNSMVTYGWVIGITISHAVTLFLSALMLVGALCQWYLLETNQPIKPWVIWESIQVTLSILMFVFWSTMSIVNQFGDAPLMLYIVEFLILLIRLYMLMIVCSHFKHFEEQMGETERLVKLFNSDSWYNA